MSTSQPDSLLPDEPISHDENQQETHQKVAQATSVLALGNIISRVLGLLREVVLTNLFGAGVASDAFKIATIIPRTIYDLLIAGHVNGAIIPVLTEVIEKKGRDELWRLVSILISIVTAVMAILVILLQISAPLMVFIFGGGKSLEAQSLAVDLLRMTSPALIFMGLFSVISGTLYALRSFTWPAFATSVFNAVIVLVALLFSPAPEYTVQVSANYHVSWVLTRPDDGITILALGWVLGSVAYVVFQLPGLRGAKIRPTLNWNHPDIKRIGMLYIPVMFSLVMDTLIIRPFSYNLASGTGAGSISHMDYATTLIQFPQGLVATAISIAILPTLARQAVALNNQNDYKDTLGLGMRLTISLILPATVGLFVLGYPIIALLFEHGAFTPENTAITVTALRFYLIGLPFAALDLLMVYAFYARQDTLTPALIGLFSLVIYMIVAVVLLPSYGLYSLMIADSVKHIVHAAISAYLLQRLVGGFGSQRLLSTTFKTGLAVIVMGIVASVLLPIAEGLLNTTNILHELLIVLGVGGVSVVIFFIMAWILRIQEWYWFVSILRKRSKK
jgi:putative peptidoglycan lipid II flippase